MEKSYLVNDDRSRCIYGNQADDGRMTMRSYLEQAGRAGYRFAKEHPYANGATAMKWAKRLPTKVETRAFFRSWLTVTSDSALKPTTGE